MPTDRPPKLSAGAAGLLSGVAAALAPSSTGLDSGFAGPAPDLVSGKEVGSFVGIENAPPSLAPPGPAAAPAVGFAAGAPGILLIRARAPASCKERGKRLTGHRSFRMPTLIPKVNK